MRGGAHLAKKIRIQRDVRNKSPSEKNDMHFVRNEIKRHSRKTGNEIYLDTSYEKWDISRNVWHFTRNLVVDIEKVRQFQ